MQELNDEFSKTQLEEVAVKLENNITKEDIDSLRGDLQQLKGEITTHIHKVRTELAALGETVAGLSPLQALVYLATAYRPADSTKIEPKHVYGSIAKLVYSEKPSLQFETHLN
jgi:hypothetical protein